jgi:hypothetical protein
MKISKLTVLGVAAVLIVVGVNKFDDPERERQLDAEASNYHYITHAEATVLFNEAVDKTKKIAQDTKQTIINSYDKNLESEKKIQKAEITPLLTKDDLIKGKDKTIDGIVGFLEKLRSESPKEKHKNKP